MEIDDKDIETYKTSMNKIIKSGNPKYLTYVSKEYMRLSKDNPQLAQVIHGMINTYSKNPNSIYAILVDNDGTLNFEALTNLSKVSNVSELVKNIEALSGQNVDFGTLSSDELIIEGMQIAEELAKEVDSLDSNIDYESEDLDETVVSNLESQADNATQIATKMGSTGGAIVAIIAVVRSKISNILSKIRSAKDKSKSNDKTKDKNEDIEKKDSNEENNWIPKISTPLISKNEKEIIKNEKILKGKKGFNVDGTDDYDPSDDDVYDIED